LKESSVLTPALERANSSGILDCENQDQ